MWDQTPCWHLENRCTRVTWALVGWLLGSCHGALGVCSLLHSTEGVVVTVQHDLTCCIVTIHMYSSSCVDHPWHRSRCAYADIPDMCTECYHQRGRTTNFASAEMIRHTTACMLEMMGKQQCTSNSSSECLQPTAYGLRSTAHAVFAHASLQARMLAMLTVASCRQDPMALVMRQKCRCLMA